MIFPLVLSAENLSASKIVSIKDLREMLQKAADDGTETTEHTDRGTAMVPEPSTARETTRSTVAHVPLTPPAVQVPAASPAKPVSMTTVTKPSVPSTEGPGASPTLASLLQGSQAAEARAYFTGLLPGKVPPPRFTSFAGPKLPAVATSKSTTVPSFTGFTGKLGTAAGGTAKLDFSAVSIA